MHDIAGAGHHREQRVVAAHVVVGELGPTLLGQPVGLADARVHIDGDRPFARAGPRRPRPGQQLAGHLVQLAGVAPGETSQEGADRRGSQHRVPQHRLSRSRSQHIAVVDRVATGQRGVDHRHGLVADIRPPRGVTQVDVRFEQLPQSQMLGQGRRGDQPGVGHQPLVIECHPNAVQAVQMMASKRCLRTWGSNAASQPPFSQVRGTFSADTPALRAPPFRWIRA